MRKTRYSGRTSVNERILGQIKGFIYKNLKNQGGVTEA